MNNGGKKITSKNVPSCPDLTVLTVSMAYLPNKVMKPCGK